MARRYNRHEIETILDTIRTHLQHKNRLDYMELEEREETIILKWTSKKSAIEKKALLEELAGSGLQHSQEAIDDAIAIAQREGDDDREDIYFG
ncbi:MAG: hypothetical protein K0R57_1168 [Paenibacillaceae bacterium]|jgi:hypothetical protein|nr:hypothetical protein [Paenibacillaceae bacterium]